jgi:quinoprotein glucose dehydrogenase
MGGVKNEGPFTPWQLRAENAPWSLVFPGGLGGANWGGTATDPKTGFVFAVSQDVGALGGMQATKPGSAIPYDKTTPGRGTFDVHFTSMVTVPPGATGCGSGTVITVSSSVLPSSGAM